jgi:hypothetical protein
MSTITLATLTDVFPAPVLVAQLPSPTAGLRAMVSDATVTTFASVVGGTGSNTVPVYADGTNWRIG